VRAARNAVALGVPALAIRTGAAPAALAGLVPPDAVFLGGGAHIPGVIATCWAALRSGGRLVANGVTVETAEALLAAQRVHGGTLTRLAIERFDAIGTMHAFRPAMPVVQWAAVKP
jgi:precorrin-6Y C5,15-methyltransferase (decarboxylating)